MRDRGAAIHAHESRIARPRLMVVKAVKTCRINLNIVLLYAQRRIHFLCGTVSSHVAKGSFQKPADPVVW
jgi:hypothetical protein